MAKDVTTFLSWTAEPEHDVLKKMGLQVCHIIDCGRNGLIPTQAVMIISTMFALSIYVKRFKWAVIKNRKLYYNPPKESTH
jgi:ubiquinol-cytochrome c reductase cytochrome c1 subunit